MTLELYKQKRNFKKTPEPASGGSKGKGTLSFVIQRHDASHLHYDFRLEMDGVLKSWAVPKGPSMVAGEKRLAMMVEDHPIPYGKFYGEIPKGNYGAGTVEIWDEGTYYPVEEKGDPEKNLLKQMTEGHLKFIVEGSYLKGEFALVHMKGGKKENEWLLIKKSDEYATSTFNIEQVPPLKSKINKEAKNAAGKKIVAAVTVAESSIPFPKELPRPMLAKLSEQVMDNPEWLYETKYDGYRLISGIHEGKAELVSRNGISFNEKYSDVATELKQVKDNVILDGEVVVENARGISNFQLLQNFGITSEGELKYYVFDILYLNGHSVTDFAQVKRKKLLDMFFKKYTFKNIFNSPYQVGNGKALFNKLSKEGYEGVIAKDPESTYLPDKRTDAWLKVKTSKMQEAIICGYTAPQKSRKYIGSLILGLYDENKKLKYIGNCGTGFNETSLKVLYDKFEHLKTDTCRFEKKPRFTGSKGKHTWLRPKLVCNVKFFEWSQDEQMRHPVFMGLRIDKESEEVINESKVTMEKTKKKDQEEEKTLTINGNQVKCTHLSKVYWPGEGYTKGDLISYYQSVSKYILPYLKDRPQSLNRHPNGIAGQSFYQKDMDTAQIPAWVKTVQLFSKSNNANIDYLICNDEATLIYMANLGCIEINPWHSTYQNPDEPTYMMLDLDPGNISFVDVVNTALVIKEVCDEVNIPCYCKTSGATGLHVYFPFAAKYSYDQVRSFAEILATITHSRLPSTTSIERAVAKRTDKIYIDFLQNSRGQTIAAPYSVRPRPMATVSTPLLWKEVNHQLTPQMFTIKNMAQRLEKVGDLWAPVLKEGINLTSVLNGMEKLR